MKKPVFIVGTGRCGTTALHLALSYHPQLAWLSAACDEKPHRPWVNRRAMRILDLPLPVRYMRRRIYPVEAYRFWEHYCPGFSEPCRDLLKEDVTPAIKIAVRAVLDQMLTAMRNRLLVKITGWPRIGFLKEIFPDAKFIHVQRDGRAVANSLLGVPWWYGWRGPHRWRWGELTSEQRSKWERFDRSFVALAGIQWEILMSAQDAAAGKIPPDDLLIIRYEDLCQDPVNTIRTAVDFGELGWTSRCQTLVRRFAFEDKNYKWREHLTDAQQQVLNECIGASLQRYGYD